MDAPDKHIIRKLIIDLNISDEKKAFAVQQEIGEIVRNKLNESLDRYFKSLYRNGDHLRINHLDLDLGEINKNHLQEEITEKIIESLDRQVKAQMQTRKHHDPYPKFPGVKKDSISDSYGFKWQDQEASLMELLMFYLIRGYYPWWSGDIPIKSLEQELSDLLSYKWERKDASGGNKAQWLTNLTNVLEEFPKARERLVFQFDDSVYYSFIDYFQPQQSQYLTDIEKMLLKAFQRIFPKKGRVYISAGLEKTIKGYMIHAIFEVSRNPFAEGDYLEDFLRRMMEHAASSESNLNGSELLEALSNEENLEKKDKMPLARRKQIVEALGKIRKSAEDKSFAIKAHLEKKVNKHETKQHFKKEDAHIIENAGMVLIAWFLPPLFRNLKFVEEDYFVNDEAIQKAIHLSQLLVTGQHDAEERHLLLNKMLCGVNKDFVVAKDWNFTKEELDACEEMLGSVIRHWSVLKNTSPQGLRDNFLRREGILHWSEKVWKLQIERKTRDVVLNYLPWSYQMIRLPWMSSILHVEW